MNESSSPEWHAWPPEERNARLASKLRKSAADVLEPMSRTIVRSELPYHVYPGIDWQQAESDEALSMFTDLVRKEG